MTETLIKIVRLKYNVHLIFLHLNVCRNNLVLVFGHININEDLFLVLLWLV
jgi:hypothetical protein